MKKILSILLAVCMLLTMFTLPALAEVVEDGTYQYHKFDFSEGKDQYTGYQLDRQTVYSGMRSYATVVSGITANNTAARGNHSVAPETEGVKVDYIEYQGKTVMRVRMYSLSTITTGDIHLENRIAIQPHYKDADGNWVPVKTTPGKEYTVKYNVLAVRSYLPKRYRVMTEAFADSSAHGFRITSGGWGSAAVKDGTKLKVVNATGGDYYPTVGMYLPATVNDSNQTIGGTETAIYTITKDAGTGEYSAPAAYTSNKYQVSGKQTFAINKTFGVYPFEAVEGDWNDLQDWGVTSAGNGAYAYNLPGAPQHYTDHLAITVNNPSTANLYYEISDQEAEEYPFADVEGMLIEVGGKKYAGAYNEFYITDFEYYETGKGAVICKDGDNVKTFVGNVGDTVTLPTPAAQDGKIFLGWYKGDEKIGDANSTLTLAEGAPSELTAKWETNEVTVVDDITIMGKDIQINSTNNINGTAVSSYTGGDYLKVTDKALVLTSPNVKTGTFVSSKKVDYIMSNYRRNDKDYTLVGADGKPVVAEPNTEYIINISYKQTKPGRIGLRIGAGRKTSMATATTANTGDLGQGSAITYSNTYLNNGNRGAYYINFGATGFPAEFKQGGEANELTAGTVDTTVQTYSFGIKTGSLEGMIPEFNMISVDFGTMGRYVSSNAEGTQHTYQCVGVPEVEIYSIQILKVGSDENVVAFNGSSNNVGSSLVYKAGVADSDVEAPANFENRWYVGKAGTTTIFDGKVPTAKLTNLYDYNSVLNNVEFGSRTYIGCRGIFINEFEKDGETIQALQYKPYTYDEYYEKYGVGLQSSAAEEKTDAEKLAIMKKVYGTESWTMYRLPIDPITDGSTYKITMTYKVNNVSESKPLRLQFTLGQFSNASSMSADVGYYLEDEFRFTTDTGEEYKTSTFFLTPEFCATVTENGLADDNFTAFANYLYIHFYHDVDDITFSTGRPEAVFSQFDVEKLGEVVVADGVSCLNETAAAQAGSQAMRVYFSYKTTNGTHIEIDGVEYEILERGFVYKNGKASGYTKNKGSEENPVYRYVGGMTKGEGLIESKVNANFHKCWAYDEETNMLTFSNYIKDIPASMESSKLIVRGYVTFQDAEGNVMTVYSDLVNRSVAGIKGTNANITPEEIPVP